MKKRLKASIGMSRMTAIVTILLCMMFCVSALAAQAKGVTRPSIRLVGGKVVQSAKKTPEKIYITVTSENNIQSVGIIEAKTYGKDDEKIVLEPEKIENSQATTDKKNVSAYQFDLSKAALESGVYYIVVRTENGQKSVRRLDIKN